MSDHIRRLYRRSSGHRGPLQRNGKDLPVESSAAQRRNCQIHTPNGQRNGDFRYWCSVHNASATGRYGRRLSVCESAYRDGADGEVLELDPSEFPGGVALWGAVEPVYNTMNLATDKGIHVHARRDPGGDKVLDKSFAEVRLPYNRDLLDRHFASVTRETGIAYYISNVLCRPLSTLYCVYCGEAHLDADWFAVKPHRRHLCHACGSIFTAERGISNPVMAVRQFYRDNSRKLVRATRVLDIQQRDFPGGIQIWASNPAILWTGSKPEKEGIHVHADGAETQQYEDDTFDRVVLDGIELDEQQLRLFMAQRALTYLIDKVASLRCPSCGEAIATQANRHSIHISIISVMVVVTNLRHRADGRWWSATPSSTV
jgi:hypothetical protein